MNMKKNANNYFSCFTLVELLMVCAIMVVLVGIGIGVYNVASRKSSESKTEAMIKKMCIALEAYKNKTGYYIQQSTASGFYVDKYKKKQDTPPDADEYEYTINDQIEIPDSELDKTANYLRGAWLDAFGNQFIYQCPGKNNRGSFDLYSRGADGIINTVDDIKNW